MNVLMFIMGDYEIFVRYLYVSEGPARACSPGSLYSINLRVRRSYRSFPRHNSRCAAMTLNDNTVPYSANLSARLN